MDKKTKEKLLESAKDFFRENIAKNHIKNTEKLVNLAEFNVNPFLIKYLANYLSGNDDPKSIAKALIYPRVLGTSITTSFGQNFQKFCVDILREYGFSGKTPGIDIEFFDSEDGKRKYCQLKSGPNNINKDDVPTIIGHFKSLRNLARVNHLTIGLDDLVVGVMYGTSAELSGHFKKINETHPVYIGGDFWKRLTGDANFYKELINAFGEVAIESNGTTLLKKVVDELSLKIKDNFNL